MNQIDVVGSIGVLLLAKRRALIPAVIPKLDAMTAGGIYVSPALVEEALRIAGEAEG